MSKKRSKKRKSKSPTRTGDPSDVEVGKTSTSESTSTEFSAEFAYFSGPLPAPHALAEYNEIVPGIAEKIFEMADRQSRHRQALEQKVVRGNIRNETLGVVFGSILFALGLGFAAWLAWLGYDETALVAMVGDILAFVGLMIFGRRRDQQELSRKQEETQESLPANR